MKPGMESILIIKHGALGDCVLASGPIKAIRHQHPNAHITLLTTKLYAKFFEACEWLDDIWIDSKPKPWHVMRGLELRRKLRSQKFSWVYDLQTSTRSSGYFRLFPTPKPYVSGIAPGASHRHNAPERTQSHTLDRQREQLRIAGIANVPQPDISWLSSDISRFNLTTPYGLLVPGGSAHRPEKRWPVQHFISLAVSMIEQGLTPVLIGTGAEASLLDTIEKAVPESCNLCNETSFEDIATLGRNACIAVGNDTGPMHMIAASDCPAIILFSAASNPDLCAPRGAYVRILQRDDLTALSVADVQEAVTSLKEASICQAIS